ncbi:MAG TPA: sialidase family protein [Mycobacteriales bacterium]|nr:sialidase family protein [Mycobacteriales bacterium]
MRVVSRLLVPLVAAGVSVPLALTAVAGPRTAAPTFQQYTSPVGVDLVTGAPEPVAGVIQRLKENPAGVPVFGVYSQTGIGDKCGEPTLAVDPRTNEVLYQCGLQTLLVNRFGKGGKAVWTPVQPPVEGLQSSDPILRQDRSTNRVWVNQLMPQGCSVQAYSDDFGRSWTQAPVGCALGISFDHQTIGAGKPTTLVTTPLYPNVLYYCTNDLATLNCGVSLDGGLTFGPSHPVFTDPGESCSPIIGHIKSAPDGTTYVMPDGCDDEAGDEAVFVTTDNALTWTKRSIPHATVGDAGHPSLGVGSDGTLYASWGSSDNAEGGGRVYVSVSRDRGAHWTLPRPLGKELGVRASRFPIAVAGDGDRAAVAYLGSTNTGNPAKNKTYRGTWRMYVSYTYDRGRTWKTYDATPGSPVQVGSVCTGGTSCVTGPDSDRNLLDFNDMVLDGKGRVVIAFADGCLKAKGCTTHDRMRKGAILWQQGGKSLLRKFD